MDCKKCLGDGLLGAGDQPHLKQGTLKTCPDCAGTGKAPEAAPEQPAEEAQPAAEAAPEAPAEAPEGEQAAA